MRGPDRNHPFLNLTSLTGGGGGGGGPWPMALAGRHSSARADEKRDCGDTLRTAPAAGEATAVGEAPPSRSRSSTAASTLPVDASAASIRSARTSGNMAQSTCFWCAASAAPGAPTTGAEELRTADAGAETGRASWPRAVAGGRGAAAAAAAEAAPRAPGRRDAARGRGRRASPCFRARGGARARGSLTAASPLRCRRAGRRGRGRAG
mmetsp:Transcript_49047/g.155315  ORF Transcript_49047/g.155315 Transcript_49047/m.155315 type:complete len:208 (-) Transcript_49047:634-1257(-)